MTSDFVKIMMPMIRKVMPTLIATEILGVQPMFGSIFARRRERLFASHPVMMTNMVYNHIAIRDFMIKGSDLDPNDKYRAWLEENIGVQGKDWNWDIRVDDLDMLEIGFAKSEYGTLFELTWP